MTQEYFDIDKEMKWYAHDREATYYHSKMRENRKIKTNKHFLKPIIVLTNKNEFVCEFTSASEATQVYKFDANRIRNAAKQGLALGNHIFIYKSLYLQQNDKAAEPKAIPGNRQA